jgi:Arc/MetJ-type ribon-helix-helix transcriptional regulator
MYYYLLLKGSFIKCACEGKNTEAREARAQSLNVVQNYLFLVFKLHAEEARHVYRVSVTFPSKDAEWMQNQVDNGECASVAEVVRMCVRAMRVGESRMSKEKMIEIVMAQKKDIVETTDEIDEVFQKFYDKYNTEDFMHKTTCLDSQNTLLIKKKVNDIISKLSIIGGFCDKDTQRYIDTLTGYGGKYASLDEISVVDIDFLSFWSKMVNRIIVDFTRTPFKLAGEFKVQLANIKGKIKALYKKS